jgi:hypothetical protein
MIGLRIAYLGLRRVGNSDLDKREKLQTEASWLIKRSMTGLMQEFDPSVGAEYVLWVKEEKVCYVTVGEDSQFLEQLVQDIKTLFCYLLHHFFHSTFVLPRFLKNMANSSIVLLATGLHIRHAVASLHFQFLYM